MRSQLNYFCLLAKNDLPKYRKLTRMVSSYIRYVTWPYSQILRRLLPSVSRRMTIHVPPRTLQMYESVYVREKRRGVSRGAYKHCSYIWLYFDLLPTSPTRLFDRFCVGYSVALMSPRKDLVARVIVPIVLGIYYVVNVSIMFIGTGRYDEGLSGNSFS